MIRTEGGFSHAFRLIDRGKQETKRTGTNKTNKQTYQTNIQQTTPYQTPHHKKSNERTQGDNNLTNKERKPKFIICFWSIALRLNNLAMGQDCRMTENKIN
jgi:hypothetical protein